jgi:hypothetical protein
MISKQVEFLVKIRDAHLTFAKATNEYIESLAPPEVKNEIEKPEDKETPFTELNFEREEGPKIGAFEAAYKADNPQDKWIQAYNILTASKASIKNRYHNEGYQYSYWLYEGNKIYRQKLKPKTN